MSALRSMLFLVLLSAGTLPAGSEPERDISFARLPQSDRLVIFFEWSGCFHYSAAEFIYHPAGNGSFEVVDMILNGYTGGKYRYRRSTLGLVQLEAGEKQKLDAMLHHYRNPAPVDIILTGPAVPRFTINQLRGSKVVAREKLSSDVPEQLDPAILTFGEMYAALARAKKNEPGN